MTRRLLPVLLFASATLLKGAVSVPEITGRQTEITDAGTVFTGDAKLVYEGVLLRAHQIAYNPRTQTAIARGQVSLTRGPQRLLADEVTYNLETRAYTVKHLRFGQDPVYISGTGLDGSPDKVIIHDAVVTFSEPGLLSPSVRASKLTYQPGNNLEATKAYVGVGPFRPIPIPLYQQSVNDPLISHLHAKAGVSSNLGGELELSLLAPFTRSVKLGGELDLYTKRGVMFGPAADYQFESAHHDVRGSLRTGYINDQGDRDRDILGEQVPKDRGFIGWDHYQTLDERLTLLGHVNYWSDSEVIRDFRPDTFERTQTPDNFVEGYYTGDNYVVSAFTRFQPNDYHVVQRRLPEIRFDGLPVDVGAGVYHRVNASFAALEDNSLPATEQVNRVDTYYALTRPFSPREWLSIKPVAGARFTYYDRANLGREDYSRVLGEIGFDADLTVSSTYAYKNERWEIDGLRHLVKPYVSYRAIPDANRGERYIPRIDRTPFSTYLQPLGLGDRRDIDQLGKMNALRLGLDNQLQTRDATYGSRNLAELELAADWRFDREANQERFSAIQGELAIMPARWLRFDVFTSVTPQDMTLQELNTGVTFQDAGVWSVRVGTDYLNPDPTNPIPAGGVIGLQEYTLDLRYYFNEVYEALVRLSYDSRDSRFTRQSFGLRQNIRNLWIIDYVLTFRRGDERAGSTGFSVSVELANF